MSRVQGNSPGDFAVAVGLTFDHGGDGADHASHQLIDGFGQGPGGRTLEFGQRRLELGRHRAGGSERADRGDGV